MKNQKLPFFLKTVHFNPYFAIHIYILKTTSFYVSVVMHCKLEWFPGQWDKYKDGELTIRQCVKYVPIDHCIQEVVGLTEILNLSLDWWYFKSEINIPKEISSAYSCVIFAQRSRSSTILLCWLQGSLDCSQNVNIVQYNCCMTTMVECGGLFWNSQCSHMCMSFIWMAWTD